MTVDRDSGDGRETVDVIGCSVRGQKNRAKEIPCQDDNERRRLPGRRYVIVAADGLGSASLSHVGSRVATQAVADYVEEAVTGMESLNEEALRSVLREAFVHAREQLHDVANSRGAAVSELNTTLLVAVGGPAGVGGVAVGDGGIVWHRGGRTDLLVPREDTEYGNETIPVQSNRWEESYRFGWMPDADAAAVFSDGIDAVAWDGSTSVSDDLFDQVFDNVREFSDTDRLERFLEDFLDGEALRQSSRDDKTLVVGALPGSEWADPAETEPHESPVEDRHDEGTAATGPTSGTETDDESSENATHETGDDVPASTAGSRPATSRPRKADIDEQLGDNGIRHILPTGGIVGIVVVVVLLVVLAAALLTGAFLGSDGGGHGQFEITTQSATEAIEGENITITVEIENTGDTNQTQTIELDVGELGRNQMNVTLSGGNVTEETLTLGTQPGDAGSYPATIATDNNTAETTIEVLAPAEFTVEMVETTTPVAGEQLNVTFVVKNTGDIRETQPIELDIGQLDDDSTNVTLAGGSETEETVTFTTEGGDAGDYTANISSLNETTSATVTVLAPASFTVEEVMTNRPVEGETLTVTAQIANEGDVEATRTVALNADGLDENQTEVTLAGGESRNVTLSVATEAGDAGEHPTTVSIGSNMESTDVMVLPPANFTVNITDTNTPVEGENLTVTAQIANEGDNQRTQTVELSVESLGRNSTNVTLDGEDTTETTLNLTTDVGDANNYTATVLSANGTNSTNVRVVEADQLPQAELLKSTGGSVQPVQSATSFGRNDSEQRQPAFEQHFVEEYTKLQSYWSITLTNTFSAR